MDNSSEQPINPAIEVPQETSNTPEVTQANTTSSSKGKIMFIGLGVVLLLVFIGVGAFYFLGKPSITSENAQVTTAPALETQDLQNELNSLDEGNIDEDFAAIDQDLKSL